MGEVAKAFGQKGLTKTGWLLKWTNYLKGYQKRYFVLQDGVLSYYKNESEMHTCRGEISLLSAVIHPEDSCSFIITKGGTETFHIRAENEVERQKWVTALELAKSEAVKESEEDEFPAAGYSGGDLRSEREELNELLKPLIEKLNHLKACTEKINKHANGLQKTLADIEQDTSLKRNGSAVVTGSNGTSANTNPSTAGTRPHSPHTQAANLKQLSERTALFKITLAATVNSCNQYTQFAQSHFVRWFKKLQHEHEARLRLEEIVEQLAKQHSHLEEKAKKQVQHVQLASSNNEEEDEEFYDAEENATDFFVSIPGKAQRLQSCSGAAFKGVAWPGGARSIPEELASRSTPKTSSKSLTSEKQVTAMNATLPSKRTEFVYASDFTSSEREEEYDDDNDDDDDDARSSDSEERDGQMIATSVITRRKSKTQDTDKQKNSLVKRKLCRKNRLDESDSLSSSNPSTPPQTPTGQSSNELTQLVSSGTFGRRRKRRTAIPPRPNQSLNLWSFMKNCIGKELTKIPMPCNFNEPLSMLQRVTEDFEYADLLHKCARISDPAEQLIYIAAFCVSHYATTGIRTCKPFNPLLGETFECDRRDDLGWRSIAEQVSHHPPMLAMHVEGRGWFFYSEFGISSKFRGRFLQVNPIDINHLEFPDLKYHYSWRKITTTVNNIIVGKLWVDNHGDMTITNHNTGHKCHLKFAPYSYFSRDTPRRVTGVVVDKDCNPKWVLKGTWDHKMEASKVIETHNSSKGNPVIESSTPKIIWKKSNPPPNSAAMYNLTQLAIELNEPEEGVAPTDSRNRPDQRLMEEGNWDEANRVKQKLEQKQREVRRAREELVAMSENPEEIEYKPKWFEKSVQPYTGVSYFKFKGDYWDYKENQDWQGCPDIYTFD